MTFSALCCGLPEYFKRSEVTLVWHYQNLVIRPYYAPTPCSRAYHEKDTNSSQLRKLGQHAGGRRAAAPTPADKLPRLTSGTRRKRSQEFRGLNTSRIRFNIRRQVGSTELSGLPLLPSPTPCHGLIGTPGTCEAK